MRGRFALGVLALAAVGGCDRGASDSDPDARRRGAASSVPDSASIFGDPGLTPQREGEHARRELALAGDAHRAIEALEVVDRLEVVVRLGDEVPARVLVTGTTAREIHSTRAEVEAVARNAVAPTAAVDIRLSVAETPPEEGPRNRPALWLVLVALGASLGVAVDRTFRRT